MKYSISKRCWAGADAFIELLHASILQDDFSRPRHRGVSDYSRPRHRITTNIQGTIQIEWQCKENAINGKKNETCNKMSRL